MIKEQEALEARKVINISIYQYVAKEILCRLFSCCANRITSRPLGREGAVNQALAIVFVADTSCANLSRCRVSMSCSTKPISASFIMTLLEVVVLLLGYLISIIMLNKDFTSHRLASNISSIQMH